MDKPFYRGDGSREGRGEPVALPQSRRAQFMSPDKYRADSGLVDAVNVALLLNQPLLLTGEPGTGKTQLAYNLAWELGYGEPLKFEIKSTSTARDLFYTYDALKRFQEVKGGNSNREATALSYLTYNALGIAILRTNEKAAVAGLLPSEFVHRGKQRSVVVIDEVDKAPRDFPNDVLNELEHMYFRVPELNNVKIVANPELQPVVIITSNSEKDLPDAFLRRCIYYNIPFPHKSALSEIVANRLGLTAAGSSQFLQDTLEIFYELRAQSSLLRKKPTTAELLGWITVLKDLAPTEENPLSGKPERALRTLNVLVKTTEDQEKAAAIVERWITKRRA